MKLCYFYIFVCLFVWFCKYTTFSIKKILFTTFLIFFHKNKMNTKNETAVRIGASIQNFFDQEGISQQDAAERLGVTQAAVSARICGLQAFGKNAAKKWHDAFGFRVPWLITGEGAMFDDGTPAPVTQTITHNSGLAIQQAGQNAATGNGSPRDEGFFTRLCSQLMEQIIERDRRICVLEKQLKEKRENED